MIEFEEKPEFSEDLENLSEKFGSIRQDFELLKKALNVRPQGASNTVVRIYGLGAGVILPIFKVRRFRCSCLKGKGSNSGIRVIYAFNKNENKITFIEMYYKDDQSNHDQERILKYFNS